MKDKLLNFLICITIIILMFEGFLGLSMLDMSNKVNTMREAMISMYNDRQFQNSTVYPAANYYATDPNTEKSQTASLIKIGKELEKMNYNFSKLIDKIKK